MNEIPVHYSARSIERRRSVRMLSDVSLFVRIPVADGEPHREKTFTMSVNAHGALLFLAASVELGQLIVLENPDTEKEIEATILRVGPAYSGLSLVAVEFLKPCEDFWKSA